MTQYNEENITFDIINQIDDQISMYLALIYLKACREYRLLGKSVSVDEYMKGAPVSPYCSKLTIRITNYPMLDENIVVDILRSTSKVINASYLGINVYGRNDNNNYINSVHYRVGSFMEDVISSIEGMRRLSK